MRKSTLIVLMLLLLAAVTTLPAQVMAQETETPTDIPTEVSTEMPTDVPTDIPPTDNPTLEPTDAPTFEPTADQPTVTSVPMPPPGRCLSLDAENGDLYPGTAPLMGLFQENGQTIFQFVGKVPADYGGPLNTDDVAVENDESQLIGHLTASDYTNSGITVFQPGVEYVFQFASEQPYPSYFIRCPGDVATQGYGIAPGFAQPGQEIKSMRAFALGDEDTRGFRSEVQKARDTMQLATAVKVNECVVEAISWVRGIEPGTLLITKRTLDTVDGSPLVPKKKTLRYPNGIYYSVVKSDQFKLDGGGGAADAYSARCYAKGSTMVGFVYWETTAAGDPAEDVAFSFIYDSRKVTRASQLNPLISTRMPWYVVAAFDAQPNMAAQPLPLPLP